MKHYRWSSITEEQVNPNVRRRYLNAERMTVGRFELKAPGILEPHSHENEQVTCIISGALKFKFKDGDVVARAGDVVQIPSWAEHGVEILEDTVAIDVFTPIRSDWRKQQA